MSARQHERHARNRPELVDPGPRGGGDWAMTLSRRDLIVGVGAGAPAVAAVPSLAHAAVRRVGIAPEARQSIGVIGTIEQDGVHLTGFGWLTQVRGLGAHDLFTD